MEVIEEDGRVIAMKEPEDCLKTKVCDQEKALGTFISPTSLHFPPAFLSHTSVGESQTNFQQSFKEKDENVAAEKMSVVK